MPMSACSKTKRAPSVSSVEILIWCVIPLQIISSSPKRFLPLGT